VGACPRHGGGEGWNAEKQGVAAGELDQSISVFGLNGNKIRRMPDAFSNMLEISASRNKWRFIPGKMRKTGVFRHSEPIELGSQA
jgi:hypothetical protein